MPSSPDRAARSLPDVCNLAVSDAAEFFSELDLDETGQLIAAEVLKEIRGRLGFSDQCRPQLSDAQPHGSHALGRRIAAYSSGRADRLRLGRRALHPGRAVDRPASARQRPAAGHALPLCAIWAIQWSSSSTTKTLCGRPITLSTSAPGRAFAAEKWSPAVRPRYLQSAKSLTGQFLPASGRSKSPPPDARRARTG